MFGALIAELGAAELSEVMRFDQQWERDASARLREGDFAVVAARMTGAAGSGAATGRRRSTVPRVHGWPITCTGGTRSCSPGRTRKPPNLARRVQAQLVTMGTVQPRAPLADGNRAGTGDLIRARLNTEIDAGGQRLTNRDVLRIEGWQGQDAEVVRRLPGGAWSARFLVPRSYLACDAELQYAGNIHVAQGRTARHLARAGHGHAVPAIPLRGHVPRAREQYRARGDRGNRAGRKGAVRAGDRRRQSSIR